MTTAADIDVATLRSWLARKPRPETLRLTFSDGAQEHLPREDQNWQIIAESIVALEPVLIEALDTTKRVIRAVKSEDLDGARKSRDNSRVQPPSPLHSDPETARLCYFADLIHRAYQHSTDVAFDKVTGAYDTAFNRMIDLVEKIGERSDAIERRLERAESAYRREVNERLQEALERATEDGDGGGLVGMLKNFLGGIEMGQAAHTETPPPTNGKGTA